VPGLYVVGLPSAQSFGPVMRFVYGTRHAATILTRHLRPAPRRSIAETPAPAPVAPLGTRSTAPRP